MSGDRAFVDTNVLVYAVDHRSPQKRDRARRILGDLGDGVVLNTQVLLEFFVTATRKLAPPVSADECERRVSDLSRLDVVDVSASLVLAAIALARSNRLSVWDALIVESALSRGCSRLLSEDFQHGREFGRLRVENPFADL